MSDILKICYNVEDLLRARKRLGVGFLLGIFAFCLGARTLVAGSLPAFEAYFADSKLGKVESQESQHFKVSWINPQDGILAGPMLLYMEAAYESLLPKFSKVALKNQKAPLEIFPDLKSFSEVSGLSLSRFRATGTIALTLDQRLMILSPRNLAKGYPWAETAVHEFIHFMIRRISFENVPIWLHEGTAQIFQGYPYQKEMRLDPSQWGLFKKRRAANKLLDLKTLQEPFPYRETPEEAELAYIQALLFANWLDTQCGVIKLIEWSGSLKSVDRALEKCTGKASTILAQEFSEKIMPGIQVPKGSDVEFYARDFSSDDPIEAEGKKTDQKSRNLATLANELFKQGRYRSSSMEMEKALVSTPVAPPSWRQQLGISLMRSSKPKESQMVLRRLLKDYPREASAYFLLATQELERSELEKAWPLLVQSFFVNPFLDGLSEKMAVIQERKPKLAKDFVLHPLD